LRLAAPNFEEAVVLAVNHSGDSDSTVRDYREHLRALYESRPFRLDG
jgi:hypothetical protein